MQDDGFLKAIHNGSEYNLVYDISQELSVKEFLGRITTGFGSRQIGIVHAKSVDARSMPLIQFIILEYEWYKEFLLGYGLGPEIATTHEIYLVRSAPLCEYLRHVHDNFIRLLAPKT